MKELSLTHDPGSLCILYASDVYTERTKRFSDFIAFGDWTDDGYGPSVRFHGGTEFTECIRNAPVLRYDVYGQCHVVYSEWMNKNNCPNAFDEGYISEIINFVQSNLPILMLVYNRNLDKEDALSYFEGKMDWDKMLSHVYRIPDGAYVGMLDCRNNAQLHIFCVGEMIYGQQEGPVSSSALLNKALMPQLQPVFELENAVDEIMLTGYHGSSETVRIPEGVEIIDFGVFSGHTEIKKVIFPQSLRVISDCAFSGCSGIEGLIIPSEITLVAHRAFENCANLKHVCFEQRVKVDYFEMEDCAFSGCVELTEVRMPMLSSFLGNPFDDCPKLKVIHILDEPPEKSYNAIIWGDTLWIGCNGTIIPNGVKEIEWGAFGNCPDIRELVIPDSVVRIDDGAFYRCPNLTILCSRGSYAEWYTKKENIPYRYFE